MQLEHDKHRPWALTGPQGRALRIGGCEIALADVRGVEFSSTAERDVQASLLNFSAYLVVAATFIVLVVQAGWRERFLLGGVFFLLICLSSLIDIGRANRIRLYRLRLHRNGAPPVDFTTADAAEAQGLLAVLKQAGKA